MYLGTDDNDPIKIHQLILLNDATLNDQCDVVDTNSSPT